MLERYDILEPNNHHLDVYRLDRYDLHKKYEVLGNGTCHVRNTEGKLPAVWEWIQLAYYDGTQWLYGKNYEVWVFHTGYAKVGVAVDASNPDRPIYLFVNSTESNVTIKLTTWNTATPKESTFAVPTKCDHNAVIKAAPGCVARSTMTSRARDWVNAKVPYCQTCTHDGYREDCSGYVSMAWGVSKPGYTTFTLPEISHAISKASLEPGDVLLCRTEHVVIFGGWASSDKSHYTAYEETRPGEGTVKRVTPYPYWYNTGCFLPYRYNSVC